MAHTKSGAGRVFGEIVMGAVTIFLIESAIKFFLPPEYLTIYRIVTVIAMILLLRTMKYWSTRYIFGWIVGVSFLFVISNTALVSSWELWLYLAVPVYVLVKRAL
jgi:hypothetical protein